MLRIAFITTDNREDTRDYTPEKPWFGTAPQALLDGFAEFPDDVEIHVVSCTRRHLESSIGLAPNIVFHSVHVPAWAWMKTLYIGNILAVRRCLEKIEPHVVHGQGTERDCALCAVFSGYPNLITIHGNMRRIAKSKKTSLWSFFGIASLLESLAIRLTGGVICLSSYSHELVAPAAKKTWRIPNAVTASFFHHSSEKRIQPPIILVIGDIVRHKNQLAFLEAIASLKSTMDFSVELYGKAELSDPYAAEVLRFVKRNSWCVFKGFSAQCTVISAYQKASMLAIPSLEENLPMVVLEAMASGLPVAAAAVGGIPDMIKSGETGVLFDPRDYESMRTAISGLIADSNSHSTQAIRALKQTLNRNLPATVAKAHLDVYRCHLSDKAITERPCEYDSQNKC